jgi:hypothetical protein
MATFSYIAPLITDKAGLPDSVVPLALAGYGLGSLIGTNLAGRYADRATASNTDSTGDHPAPASERHGPDHPARKDRLQPAGQGATT